MGAGGGHKRGRKGKIHGAGYGWGKSERRELEGERVQEKGAEEKKQKNAYLIKPTPDRPPLAAVMLLKVKKQQYWWWWK